MLKKLACFICSSSTMCSMISGINTWVARGTIAETIDAVLLGWVIGLILSVLACIIFWKFQHCMPNCLGIGQAQGAEASPPPSIAEPIAAAVLQVIPAHAAQPPQAQVLNNAQISISSDLKMEGAAPALSEIPPPYPPALIYAIQITPALANSLAAKITSVVPSNNTAVYLTERERNTSINF